MGVRPTKQLRRPRLSIRKAEVRHVFGENSENGVVNGSGGRVASFRERWFKKGIRHAVHQPRPPQARIHDPEGTVLFVVGRSKAAQADHFYVLLPGGVEAGESVQLGESHPTAEKGDELTV